MKIIGECKDPARAAGAVLDEIFTRLGDAPILFLSSGGSALSILEAANTFPPQLTIGLLDERFTTNRAGLNRALLEENTYFKTAREKGAAYLDQKLREGKSLEEEAPRFEKELLSWRGRYPKGIIVATIGMGLDGHTAGIFPLDDEKSFRATFLEGRHLFVGHRFGALPYHERLTVTPYFLKTVRHALSVVAGAEKEKALAELSSDNLSLHRFPAKLLKEMPSVTIFTDRKGHGEVELKSKKK